ncbi:MAG: Cof-type HAD-IIB family hydrolase [Lachnospiraceae bacterium]|nr:Cof-type HAD-IIB family hydrolase [Lachnospiraceae bacterium]
MTGSVNETASPHKTEKKPGQMLLATDLDGTLLSSDKSVSRRNLDAITAMVNAGHKFVIATGRPVQSALTIAARYGWDTDGYYISSFNGGLVYDCGRKQDILVHGLKIADVSFILKSAHAEGLHAHTYDKHYVVSEHDTPELARYVKGILMPGKVVPDIRDYLSVEPIKAIVISTQGRERLQAFQQKLSSFSQGRLSYTFSNPTFLEYGHIDSSKGNSVLFLADFFGIEKENIICCGDEENDLSMIESAGLGVVMANGTDFMKERAGYVTENDNDHDGIAEVIHRFIL